MMFFWRALHQHAQALTHHLFTIEDSRKKQNAKITYVPDASDENEQSKCEERKNKKQRTNDTVTRSHASNISKSVSDVPNECILIFFRWLRK